MSSNNSRHYNAAYVLSSDQPLESLEAKSAFDKLTVKEKHYAHYICKASFYGGLIVLLQTSIESPQIFRLIQRINFHQSATELEEALKSVTDIDEDDLKAFFVYCSGIYGNMGNYKGFGDCKFVPDLTPEKMETIVKHSKAWEQDPEGMAAIWKSCKKDMWSLSDREKQLGMGCKGITKYFSGNCDEADGEKVNMFFKEHKIEGYNNRVIKTVTDGRSVYEIRHAGVQDRVIHDNINFEGADFKQTTGDYQKLLELVVKNLASAKDYAANEVEEKMLDYYIKSFQEGSLAAHKDGSRQWIRNKSPNVETYIGFIETYRDPMGTRGEFEGFVAMVNKEQSTKLKQLVDQAEKLLPKLPWPASFDKDAFLRPDFTSLDVLCFSGSGIPAGINIPNYDEIRQVEGFKNVHLGNVISASYKCDKKTTFVSMEDHLLLKDNLIKAFEVQVGLHELLGHGSGKLFQVDSSGNSNYDVNDVINPLTGGKIDPSAVYQAGETYDSKFTTLGSAYEECRAEAVGLYLCFEADVLKLFGLAEASFGEIIYVNWLSLCLSGLKGLEMYSPVSNEWKQAHSQARFAILRVLLEAGEGFLKVTDVVGEDGEPDLLLSLDKTKLESVGRPALREFLLKLQVYKSMGDISSASAMFKKYTNVNESDSSMPWSEWRKIVMARKRPRKILIQPNTYLKNGNVELQSYEPSLAGMVESWRNRFTPEEHKMVDGILLELYEKDLPHHIH